MIVSTEGAHVVGVGNAATTDACAEGGALAYVGSKDLSSTLMLSLFL